MSLLFIIAVMYYTYDYHKKDGQPIEDTAIAQHMAWIQKHWAAHKSVK